MNKLYAFLLMIAAVMPAMGEEFEYQGLWYSGSEGGKVKIIKNPNGEPYSGEVVIPRTVSFQNQEYDKLLSCAPFDGSEITQLTYGGLLPGEKNNNSSVSNTMLYLRGVRLLERIKFLTPVEKIIDTDWGSHEKVLATTIFLQGEHNVTDWDVLKEGDNLTLTCNKFEFYGPNGQNLKPALLLDEYCTDVMLHPDENNRFHLKLFQGYVGTIDGTTDTTVGFISISSADLICMVAVDDEGVIYGKIRLYNRLNKSGLQTQVNGVTYDINNGQAFPSSFEADENGNVTIMPYVEYGGQTYPVTTISPNVFNGCDLSSVILPSTLQTIGYSAFANCPNLSSVHLPQGLKSISWDVFSGCPNLQQLAIPDGCKLDNSFNVDYDKRDCGLVDFEIFTDGPAPVMQINHFGFTDYDGQPLPFNIVCSYNTRSAEGSLISNRQTLSLVGNYVILPEEFFADEVTGRYFSFIYPGATSRSGGMPAEGSAYGYIKIGNDAFSSVRPVEDSINETPEYYTLQGVRVDAPKSGLYIVKRGHHVTKQYIR